MKKALTLILLIGLCWAVSAQDKRGGDLEGIVSQKFALVIGNANYLSWEKLDNPINDAFSMKTALEGLGFSVEYITDGSLERIETAVSNLKRRLSTNNNSYGFFYFAGHGVETNGQNYLIPSNANIPNRNVLRERAISLQSVLDELREANNVLNVIVLDACRNLPLALRGGSRGLIPVQMPHPGSIIVYSTGAGQTAEDNSTGANGLFTGQLLQHIKTPGIEVNELFRRTSLNVQQVSNNTQIPAIYNTFHGLAYLGSRPDNSNILPPSPPTPIFIPVPTPEPAPLPVPITAQQQFERDIEAIRANQRGSYIVILTGDIVFTSTFNFSGMQGKIITLQGDNVMRSITNVQNNNDYLFNIPNECALILGNNISLNGNNKHTVNINSGNFEMRNGSIVRNSIYSGITINGGNFEMQNGSLITNNGSSGVSIDNKGTFNLNGGTISNNNYGGVYVYDGTFNMNNGNIINNKNTFGGGVNVGSTGKFYMNGGIIASNTADKYGGGVYVSRDGVLRKTGGTIYGSDGKGNSNRALYNRGFMELQTVGHAVSGYTGSIWIARNRTYTTNDNIY